jgi:hypothetical protein
MTGSSSSSTSISSAVLVASSRCFLSASLTESKMRGSRMPLKISLSPSIATKWRSALRQAWTEAPAKNQGRYKQKHKKKQPQGQDREVNYVPVDAVQSRIMLPTCVVDSMSNWRRRGSFCLPPLQGVLPLMS